MKLRLETKKGLHVFHIGYNFIEQSHELEGYTNQCADGQYITLLDYDNGWYLKKVIENKVFLEEKYGIHFDLLFQTNKGFHLVSLDKVSFNILREILQDSLCDPHFCQVPFDTYLHSSTLRIGKKDGKYPKFCQQFMRKHDTGFELSNAHLEFLQMAYPEIKKPEGEFDNLEKVEVVTYWSK